MELVYFKDPKYNFGDDLNDVIWPALLSDKVREASDLTILGIGSILNQRFRTFAETKGTIAVLGSGSSYGEPPIIGPNWLVAAVRGPFTAAVIGRPEAAITDGAILLADVVQKTDAARSDILFMPHHHTIGLAPWEAIAAAAGMRYITPQQPVDAILAAFSKAKLVVTEAMHGAIVADTLRIPWVPVVIAPTIDEFKWRDWALSMKVPFKPVHLPAGSSAEFSRYRAQRAFLRGAGLQSHDHLSGSVDATTLKAFLARRYANSVNEAMYAARIGSLTTRMLSRALRFNNDRFERKAAASLRAVAESGSFYLSEDAVFEQRLEAMRRAVAAVEMSVSAARPAGAAENQFV